MLLVLARRVGNMVPTLAAVIALIFVLFSVIPGSIVSSMNDDGRGPMDAQVMDRVRGIFTELFARALERAGPGLPERGALRQGTIII